MSTDPTPAPDPEWAAAYGAWTLRTRSRDALDLLGRWAAADPRGWAAEHARCLALLPDADPAVALEAFAAVPDDAADAETRLLHGQVLLRQGDLDGVRALLDAGGLKDRDAWLLDTDLANPFLVPGADPDAWLGRLGEPFRAAGLEPPTLDDSLTGPDAAPFTWLRARPTSTARASDVVTVVVSTFRPTVDLLTAVRSLTDQSWEALEILVVDDDSGPAADPLLEQAEGLDPRVRVLRAPRNAGTYAARNLALARAGGRWVTFHDFDDWAHPRRVERQVQALRTDRVAGRSGCLRAYPDLTMTFPGYRPARLNASSLLVERETALETVGGFHLVRKSADMEYPGRLRAAVPSALRDLSAQVPLAITQLRPGSLSRTDAVPGWTRWTRIAYRDVYREWHRRIAFGAASPYLPVSHRTGGRRGPVPPTRSFSALGDAGRRSGSPFDVVLAADLRSDHTTLRRAAVELASLAASGLTVGVLHLDPPVRPRVDRGTFDRSIARLLNDRVVRWADPDDPVRVGTVLVLDPPTLLLRGGLPVRWTVDRTVLCVRRPGDLVADVPAGAGGPDPAALEAAAVAALGAPVSWRAVTGDGAALVRDAGIDAPHVPWVVRPEALPRHVRTEGRPRVGHGVLDPSAWEVSPAALLATFGAADLDVRFAHARRPARLVLGGTIPPDWLFLDDVDGLSELGFAATLDVTVLPAVGPDGVDAAREALATGAVVLAPRSGRALAEREDPDLAALVTWVDGPPSVADLHRLAHERHATAAHRVRSLALERLRVLLPTATAPSVSTPTATGDPR